MRVPTESGFVSLRRASMSSSRDIVPCFKLTRDTVACAEHWAWAVPLSPLEVKEIQGSSQVLPERSKPQDVKSEDRPTSTTVSTN